MVGAQAQERLQVDPFQVQLRDRLLRRCFVLRVHDRVVQLAALRGLEVLARGNGGGSQPAAVKVFENIAQRLELMAQNVNLKRKGPRRAGPSLTEIHAIQYLSITETPTFWKVVISSSTLPAPSSGTVSVIISFGLSFFASTICSIEG